MPNLRNGHAPGHVRDTFLAAIEAFASWHPGEPKPTVEVDYEPRQIPLSKACGLVWKCTDIVPGGEFDLLQAKLESLNYGRPSCAAEPTPPVRRPWWARSAR